MRKSGTARKVLTPPEGVSLIEKYNLEYGRPILMLDLRVLQVFGEITGDMVAPIIAAIHYINETEKDPANSPPIKIFVNTNGGSFEDGFALVDAILTSKVPTETYCLGKAQSIGLPIFLAGSRRYIYQHASVMFHGITLGEASGTAKMIRTTVDDVDQGNKMMVDFVSSRCKIPMAQLKSSIEKGKDLYLYSDSVMKYKMAHELI